MFVLWTFQYSDVQFLTQTTNRFLFLFLFGTELNPNCYNIAGPEGFEQLESFLIKKEKQAFWERNNIPIHVLPSKSNKDKHIHRGQAEKINKRRITSNKILKAKVNNSIKTSRYFIVNRISIAHGCSTFSSSQQCHFIAQNKHLMKVPKF